MEGLSWPLHSDRQLQIGCLGQIWHFDPPSEYKHAHSPLGCLLVAPSLLQRCIWDPYGAFGHVLRGWKANLTGHRCAGVCSVHSVALCKHSVYLMSFISHLKLDAQLVFLLQYLSFRCGEKKHKALHWWNILHVTRSGHRKCCLRGMWSIDSDLGLVKL